MASTTSPIFRLAWWLRLNDDDALKEDALSLTEAYLMIKAALRDAEYMEIRDEPVKLWLRDLELLANDAEDILEEYEYQLKQEEEQGAVAVSSAAPGRDGTKKTAFLDQLWERIREILKRFDDINVRREELQLGENFGDRRPETLRSHSVGHLPDESINIIYGRDDDKKALMDLLKNDNLLDIALPNHENEYVGVVIGLVGVGGIGKTTLAQILYNDQEINDYFDYKVWVTVLETADIVWIAYNILKCFIEEAPNLTQLSTIQEYLASLLQGKKFFLVLDNVWEEEKLYGLGFLLQMGLVGSKILITTRITQVAKAMCPSITFELEPLLEQYGRKLFHRHAFGGKDEDQVTSDLVRIGKKIVKKCKGLPLLLKVLGDYLREAGSNENRWIEILNHKTWEIKDDNGNNKVMEILKLSYDHLPRRWRQCFLHCSVFPKDYEFYIDDLVRFWSAHGLIETKGSRQVNDIGVECFYGLLQRSFIQSLGYKYSWFTMAERMKFSLHDIMYDLAQYILVNTSYFHLHHPVMVGRYQQARCYYEPIAGRTLFQTYSWLKPLVSIDMLLQNLKRLRVLILKNEYVFHELTSPRFLELIGNLKHLRYLYLDFCYLPNSVCSLHNLQTLECPNLEELPRDIRRLKRLQHLLIEVDIFPLGIGELVELQTLRTFRVIKGGDGKCACPSELKDLKWLSGRLKILGLNNIDRVKEAELLGLSSKPNLQCLVLEWEQTYSFVEDEYCRQSALVLGGLMPHNNLKELEITKYYGALFPDWLGSRSFTMLTTVKLSYCFKCMALPTLGELPSLIWLTIKDMPCLKRIGEEFYGRSPSYAFPSLEYLSLNQMDGLMEWWGMDKCPFPRLSELSLSSCPFLRFSISNMDMEYHQISLNHMFDTVSYFNVSSCPHVEEWCKAHISTTLANVRTSM